MLVEEGGAISGEAARLFVLPGDAFDGVVFFVLLIFFEAAVFWDSELSERVWVRELFLTLTFFTLSFSGAVSALFFEVRFFFVFAGSEEAAEVL